MPMTQTVGNTTFATPTDLDIVVTHSVRAPRQLVYDAHTKPEHLKKWLLGPDGWSMTDCEFVPTAGTRYRYAWRKDDGRTMEITGRVVEVVPPARIVTTETWGEPWPETINTVTFEESGGRTTITTTMHFPTREARDGALASGMSSGMATSYERLERYLQALA
jgi:uncharacterized protein YndB with AHSA1/START domain